MRRAHARSTDPGEALSTVGKYDRLAAGFSEREYADAPAYAARCIDLVCDRSPGLRPGERVLDLACGDGLVAGELARRGLRYTGVDASSRMVEAARARYPELAFAVARIEEYEPPEPVETTLCLRAFFYPPDRLGFFRRVAGYTRGTFVFDFRLPEFPAPEPIVDDLLRAGFSSVELRPFFLPQMRRLPSQAAPVLDALEASGPLARLLTRRVGRLFCVASA